MMVYQAVAEYSIRAKENETIDYELSVAILFPGRSKPDKYEFNRQNYHLTRTSRVRTRRRYSAF